MTSQEEQVQQRQANLAELAKLGIDVYPRRFDRRHTIAELVEAYGSRTHDELEADRIETVTAGRILAIRAFGKANFLVLSDGRAKVQVYIRQDSVPELDFRIYKLLDFGDWVGVEGRLFRTKTNEFTIWASRLHFLAKCLLPLPEKWHGLTDVEIRYRQRYLDLIVNPDSRQVFETRSRVITSIRAFMTARGYLEVETPMMQPIAGGAIARPFVTHHNTLDMPLYLRIAPELYLKRLTVGGLERVFEINRNFRNEGISTQHNPEFTMMEFYEAYADYHALMQMTEELIATAARDAIGADETTFGEHQISLRPPFARVSLREAARDAASRRLHRDVTDAELRDRETVAASLAKPAGDRGRSRATAPGRSPRRSSKRCARPVSSSRRSSTTFRPRCRRCRSRSRTTRTRWSGSSSTSAGSRWPTPSASSTTRWSSGGGSRRSSRAGRAATSKRTRWTRTTSARSNTGCRPPAAKAWGSIAW